MNRWFGFFILLLASSCVSLESHVTPKTKPSAVQAFADPSFLEQYAATRRFSAGQPASVTIVPDGGGVLFLRSGPRSFVQDLYELDAHTGQEHLLLTAEQILRGADEELSAEEKARRERMRVSARGIVSYRLSDDGSRILVPLSGRLFIIERASGRISELKSENGYPIDPQFSPDGRSVACVRDKELFVFDIAGGHERQLTHGASDTISHGLAEFVAQEEMGRRSGYWWSPDSRRIVYQRTDTAGMETMHIMDAVHPERPPQSWPYPRPGKKNADVQLGIISRDGGDTTWVSWDRQRYPYLATVRWEENAPLTILVQNRRQTEEALLEVDPQTGSSTILLIESDDAWINLDQSMPKWVADGSAFLWTSERSGSWQLELHGRDGRWVKNLIEPSLYFKDFLHLDDSRGVVYVSASDDPTQSHVFRISLDGASAPVRLTDAQGLHSFAFSRRQHDVYYHSASMQDGRQIRNIRRVDGKVLGSLGSVAEEPPFLPNVEFTTVGKNPTFHAVLVRPRNFEPKRKYPVIVSVYGGPHAQTVRATPRSYLLQQWLADHGFIVISLDGRGTPSRGRDWERTIKGDLISIPLQDQVNGLTALGRRYSELDLERVGIYGWSFGGYFAAHAVMQRPDVFHAAVAGAPVADWRDYDTHYTERYMGLPEDNSEGYQEASALTHCDKLQRPLLIIHGTADDNVYFLHSLKMSGALFRAGRPHELLALSDFTHMVTDPLVTTRLYQRIVAFFCEHLSEGAGSAQYDAHRRLQTAEAAF